MKYAGGVGSGWGGPTAVETTDPLAEKVYPSPDIPNRRISRETGLAIVGLAFTCRARGHAVSFRLSPDEEMIFIRHEGDGRDTTKGFSRLISWSEGANRETDLVQYIRAWLEQCHPVPIRRQE